jgi:hypothetical protein
MEKICVFCDARYILSPSAAKCGATKMMPLFLTFISWSQNPLTVVVVVVVVVVVSTFKDRYFKQRFPNICFLRFKHPFEKYSPAAVGDWKSLRGLSFACCLLTYWPPPFCSPPFRNNEWGPFSCVIFFFFVEYLMDCRPLTFVRHWIALFSYWRYKLYIVTSNGG